MIERCVSLGVLPLDASATVTACMMVETTTREKNTKVTPAVKEKVRAILEINPPSLAVVRQKLYEDSALSLSKPTLRKIALSLGFKYGAARKVPKLTDAGKVKRVAFCRAHTDTDFKSWIFSDETYISLYEGTKMLWYRPSKRPEVKVSGWGPKVMVWCMIRFNKKPVYKVFAVGKTMVSQSYTETLEEHLLFRGHNAFTFQHDLAKPHTSRLTQNWLEEHHQRVAKDYPACSPDLNIIENVFAIVKREIRRRGPETIEDLLEDIEEVFDQIPLLTVNNLFNSMPSRISEVIRVNGNAIHV